MRRLSQQWRLGLWAPHRGGSSHLTLSIFRGAWTQDQSRKKARTGIVQGPTVLSQERPCLFVSWFCTAVSSGARLT